jgi:antitoxin (DNA-binding transcriptional repressor) of toxin-antitoxin stability system
MITVGIREIKNRLSEYLRRAKAGERIIVTERGKPVAVITRPGGVVGERIEAMVRERQAFWEGVSRVVAGKLPKSRARRWPTLSSRTAVEALPRHERSR